MKALVTCVALTAALFAAAPAIASTVRVAPLGELVQRSQWIGEVTILADAPVATWVEGRIFTTYQAEVRYAWRGTQKSGERVSIRVLGGVDTARNIGQKVEGSPSFVAGENVLLLAVSNDTGLVPLGLWQGVFRLTGDTKGEPAKVSVSRQGGGTHNVGEASIPANLAELRRSIGNMVGHE